MTASSPPSAATSDSSASPRRTRSKGLLGMLSYTYLWFEPDGEVSPEALADEFLDALLDGVRRPAEPHQ
ncbi:hypothetical protein ABZ944_37860 [Streptomyces flaveolus]